jgi:PAS domain S-box-containing protein
MRRKNPFSWLEHQLSLLTLNKGMAQIASAIAILVGCLVLLGWSLDISFLKSVIPQAATMKANTAIGFILAGISLGLQTRKRQGVLITTLAQGCAIAVITLGLLNLWQYVFNWNLGIDELLFKDTPISPQTDYPGRMGDNTALNFALTGLAIYLNGKRTRRSYYVAQTAIFITAVISLLATVGYAYDVKIFYQFIFYSSSMAIHTALTFLVLCIGILFLQKNHGWMQIITSNLLGGLVARRLIPAAIAVPLVLGWLIRQGQLAGWYDPNFGLSLMVMSLIVILLRLIERSAAIINKIDGDRKRSEDRLRSSEARLQLALSGANQGIWDWDVKTEVLTWDDRCKKIFGFPPDFPVTYEWHLNALHPDDRERVYQAKVVAIRDRLEFHEEYRTFHPDGTMHWIMARGRGYYDATGEPERISGIVMDISERKEAELAFVKTNGILQTVINGTRDVIYVKDLQGRYVLTNQAAASWLNTTVESMLGQDDLALFPDDVARQIQIADRQVIDNKEFITYQEQFPKGDELRSLLSSKYPWRNDQGEVIGMIGISIDVTELKQAEEALAFQEQRYRYIFESTGVSIWEQDFSEVKVAIDQLKASGVEDFERYFNEHPEFVQWAIEAIRILDVNEISLQIYDARDKAQLLTSMSQICLPETIPAFIGKFLAIAAGETSFQSETIVRTLEGKRKNVLFAVTFPPPAEPYDRVLVTWMDISDRKRIETALQKSESRFQRLAANVPGVIYQYASHLDGADEFTYISSRSRDIYEYEPEVLLEDFSIVWQMIHPDDVERVSAANISSAERLESFNIEFRLLPPSGKLKWVQAISMPERQSNGDIVWDGIVIDISDRKQAQLSEQFLSQLDLRLRQLSDAEAMTWETVSSLGEYLNVDRCFWHEIDWENRVAIVDRNWRRADVTDLAGTYPLENFFTSEQFDCLAAGQAIVVPDVTTHPDTAPYAQSYQPLTVAAFVAIPCIHVGRWVANLSINCTTPRNWRDDEVKLLQETVARLWSIIEQTRALQALQASEYQYRTLFETIDQGFCICQMLFDENGEPCDYRFLEVNPVFEQMTGLEQATGKTALELIPNLENFWIQIYGRVALTGEAVRFEHESKAMNRWFDVSAFRFDEAQNHKFALLFTNITARKQAEADLKERSNHIQILYETTRDLLLTNQPLTSVNTLFAKLKALIGLNVYFSYMVDEQQQKLHLMSSGGISDETARSIEWLEIGQATCGTVAQQKRQIVQSNLQQSTDPKTELVRSLGLTAYSCQPLIAQEKLFGTLSFGSLTRTEFTPAETKLFQAICDQIAIALERSELVSSLQQQTEELTRANRLKDEFLAALSHELRTPLNPILGWTKLLQTQNLAVSKTQEALTIIERNVKQQITLIDDLLDISRVVQGQFQITSQPVDLITILNAARESVHFTAIAKSITLEFHHPADAISQVMGDELRLQQVFWNLLTNGIKFTPNGGCVDIRLEQIQNNAQISITDTGIGISAEFLPHVFDRFRQADGSSTRRYDGLGLGLALVKHLVELHGGTVEAASLGEGRGATFKVNLPLLRQASFNSEETSNAQQPQADLSSSTSASSSLTGIRALVVDDEPDNLNLLDFVLTKEGAIVTTVTSPVEALTIIAENPPDILISDIGMPEMDGYELLQQVRALPNQQNQPIKAIALTAFAQQEDREKTINAGFQAYLSKPINLVDLVTAIADQVDPD